MIPVSFFAPAVELSQVSLKAVVFSPERLSL
jgi:hypothetical protein